MLFNFPFLKDSPVFKSNRCDEFTILSSNASACGPSPPMISYQAETGIWVTIIVDFLLYCSSIPVFPTLVNKSNYFSPGKLEVKLKEFVQFYNYQKHHESINNLVPVDM